MEFGGAGSHIERYVVTGVFWYLALVLYVSLRKITIHCALKHVALVRIFFFKGTVSSKYPPKVSEYPIEFLSK